MTEPESTPTTSLPHNQTPAHSAWLGFIEFFKTIGFVLIAAFLIRQWLVQPFIVDGASMEPNFHHQDYILVDKIGYHLENPNRGDVIVFHPPTQPQDNFIKRVIGLPGDLVEIRGEEVLVNGKKLGEDYLGFRTASSLAGNTTNITRQLGQNEFYVMGDNRDHSKDSREIGPIPKQNIIGRAWLVLFPLDDFTVVAAPRYPNLSQAIVQNHFAASHL